MAAKKTLVIKTAEQVRALRTPLRRELVHALTVLGECTVRDLALELGREPATLYYHVHALEKVGIVVRSPKRAGGSSREAVYRLVAPRIQIDRSGKSPAFQKAIADLQRATLRTAEREVARALAPGTSGDGGSSVQFGPPMLLRVSSRLSPKARRQAERMMTELVEFLYENNDPAQDCTHALTIAFVRTR